MLIAIIASAVIGILADWLIKSKLPEKPTTFAHFLSGGTAIAVLLLIMLIASDDPKEVGLVDLTDNYLVQEGEFFFRKAGRYEVYYPEPFVSAPALEFGEIRGGCGNARVVAVEQLNDKFVYEISEVRVYCIDTKMAWTAKGTPLNRSLANSTIQSGYLSVLSQGEGEVYYESKYNDKPYLFLKIGNIEHQLRITEQRVDGFKYDVSSFSPASEKNILWVAKGVVASNNSNIDTDKTTED